MKKIHCWMCGAEVLIPDGVAEVRCDSCGTRQSAPAAVSPTERYAQTARPATPVQTEAPAQTAAPSAEDALWAKTYAQIVRDLADPELPLYVLENHADTLELMDGYRDSEALEAQCMDRIFALRDAEEEQRRKVEAIRDAAAQKKEAARAHRRFVGISLVLAVVLLVAAAVAVKLFILDPAKKQKEAERLMESGSYQSVVTLLSEGKNSRALDYMKAEALLELGNTRGAAAVFGSIAGYQDAEERSDALWASVVNYETVVIDDGFLGIRADGTVVSHYGDAPFPGTEAWTDIVQLAREGNYEHVAGLRSDGTVVVCCMDHRYCRGEDCDTSGWTDIVEIAMDSFAIYGLRRDGTIVHTEMNKYSAEVIDPWRDIVDISANYHTLLGITAEGRVISSNPEHLPEAIGALTGVTDIDIHADCIVAVTREGKVHAWFGREDKYYVYDAVDALTYQIRNDGFLFALRKDGTVVNLTDRESGVSAWTDIVALAAGGDDVIGIRRDGTAVGEGYDQSKVTPSWSNMRVPGGN